MPRRPPSASFCRDARFTADWRDAQVLVCDKGPIGNGLVLELRNTKVAAIHQANSGDNGRPGFPDRFEGIENRAASCDHIVDEKNLPAWCELRTLYPLTRAAVLRLLSNRKPFDVCNQGNSVCELIGAHGEAPDRIELHGHLLGEFDQRVCGKFEITAPGQGLLAVNEVAAPITRGELNGLLQREVAPRLDNLDETLS